MTEKIRVSQVVGSVDVSNVAKGWEIRHKSGWRKVTLSQSRSGRRGGWSVYIEGRSTPLHFIIGTSVMVIAPVEGVESVPFLPEVQTVRASEMEFPPAVPPVEPYPADKRDGRLYLTQDQAATLVEAMRTYFPADFENYETGRFIKSLTASLLGFAQKGK
jgi:hypothetical protein